MAAAPAQAQAAYQAPEAGSVIHTTTLEPGVGVTPYEALIVATGDDFFVSRELGADADDIEAYYVEFAGFYLFNCGEDMPDAADRAAMMGLWPLRPGASADLTFADGAGVDIIAEREASRPDGQPAAGYAVNVRYGGADPFAENILIVDGIATPSLITSTTGSVTTLIDIKTPDPAQDIILPDSSVLQKCAGLF